MVSIERKDWELIKSEAIAQLRQAAIMQEVNTIVFNTAVHALDMMDIADKNNSSNNTNSTTPTA